MKLTQILAAAGCVLALAGCGASGATSTNSTSTNSTSTSNLAAYRAVVVAGATTVSTDADGVSTACTAASNGGPISACSDAASTFKAGAQAFLDQLATVTPPTGYATGDGELRQALALYISGSQLEIDGIANMDGATIQSGVAQITQGTTLLTEATAAVPTP